MDAVKDLLISYIRAADEAAPVRAQGGDASARSSVLVEPHAPKALVERLAFSLPQQSGKGKDGLLETIQDVLKYSVNTWDQGFLDKLYSSTNPVSTNLSRSSQNGWLTHLAGWSHLRARPFDLEYQCMCTTHHSPSISKLLDSSMCRCFLTVSPYRFTSTTSPQH